MAYEDDVDFIPADHEQRIKITKLWAEAKKLTFDLQRVLDELGACEMGRFSYSGMSKPQERARRDADRHPPRQPFMAQQELEDFLTVRRKSRVERAKEILQICRGVDLHGSIGNGDLSDDAVAQRLADLIWE